MSISLEDTGMMNSFLHKKLVNIMMDFDADKNETVDLVFDDGSILKISSKSCGCCPAVLEYERG